MPIHIAELLVTFEMLGKTLNLPDSVKIVGVYETDRSKIVKIRFASEKAPATSQDGFELVCDDLSMIGDMFTNPDKYMVPGKRQMTAAPSSTV